MPTLRFRPGSIGDRDRLMGVYARERSPQLPPPNVKDLMTALEDGRFVVGIVDGEILACATLIPVTSPACHTYVGELTGAFVDKPLRGAKPISLQTLMLGLRVLHHVVLLGEVNPPATNTLVTVVKHGNVGSTRNVLNARFVACGPLPAWLRYDALSWHGENVKDDWQYFRATRDTVACLAERLVAVGALNGRFGLTAAAGALDVELVGFSDIALGAGDIRGLAARSYAVELSDLPPELLYPDDLNDWGG